MDFDFEVLGRLLNDGTPTEHYRKLSNLYRSDQRQIARLRDQVLAPLALLTAKGVLTEHEAAALISPRDASSPDTVAASLEEL